jgi:predicted alpha/beta superfamily hydrolase
MSTQYPQVTIPDTEVRRLKSSLSGEEYNILVGLPAGYVASGKTYPTLYALDPHLTFGMCSEIARLLAFGEELPQLIQVGIGFSGSDKDIESYQMKKYLPTGHLDEPGSGGAEDFLRFIREDLIPFMSSEYRTDPVDRCFMGSSLGGIFGLYALFRHPDTFPRYILGSPWMEGDDPLALKFETEYAADHSDLAAQVFIGAGSLEPEFVIKNLLKLEKAFQNRNYPNLNLHTQIFEGETHLSVVPYTISRGLKVVYEG